MARPRRGRKHLIAMVGLPARGKSFTARKLAGYLSWLGYPTEVFNVGARRRTQLGPGQSHEFFDPNNKDAVAQRRALAEAVLDDALAYLRGPGRVAIYDATNTTRSQREMIRARAEAEDRDLLFVELINNELEVIEANLREAKLGSPDYARATEADALSDFRARIAHYASVYEPLGEDEGAFVRHVDRGRQIVIHEVYGYVQGRIVFFLTNLQVTKRQVWITRHGESEWNVLGRIGGDAPLSSRGLEYAHNLAAHVRGHFGAASDLDVWTSTLQRTKQTAAALGIDPGEWRALDEINAGECDGMTYAEIEHSLPQEFAARRRDKLAYRYPRGESYQDVIQRLDRVIIELERYRTPVLVIAHRAVLRALYAYFQQLPRADVPHLEMPLHTVIKLTPTAYGCLEERTPLEPRFGRDAKELP
ncbi:MAG: histidine phosphatase family protein [Deltaproteobacteria bacterium]|nr:histidine phosphatase family protein [Deltaproteobacteria bacterium]